MLPPLPSLVLLRGNSGSGKSTTAYAVRGAYGQRGMAVLSQDVVRRDILLEKDRPGAITVGLIDTMARHILAQGHHLVLEGIFYADHYGPMLTRLLREHPGPTCAFYFDLPFRVTLARHATKPVAHEYGEPELRQWWRPRDLLPGGAEQLIDEQSSLDHTVCRVLLECGLLSKSVPEAESDSGA